MSHRLNLAQRPFVDTRPANVTVAVLAVLIAVLSFFSVRTVRRYLDGSMRTRQAIASLKAEIDRLEDARRASEASLARFDMAQLATSVADANLIARRRAFSWTRFLSRLEEVLPAEVRVVSIGLGRSDASASKTAPGPSLLDEALPVSLVLVSRDPDGLPKTIRALYGSRWFDLPVPGNEEGIEKGPGDGRRLTLGVLYRDGGGRKP